MTKSLAYEEFIQLLTWLNLTQSRFNAGFLAQIKIHVWLLQKMLGGSPPHMAKQKQDDQLEHTYSSYVRIRDVTRKTYQRRWEIGRSGERGSGISVLAAQHDDDDEWSAKWITCIWDVIKKYQEWIFKFFWQNTGLCKCSFLHTHPN